MLGLTHIVNSVIGDEKKRGISGGQRKRVNVGMEMVADPSVLFLDEPTSGLDSTTSYDLVAALKCIATKGCNVVTVLHQPSYPLYQVSESPHHLESLSAGNNGRETLRESRVAMSCSTPSIFHAADWVLMLA